MAVFNSTAEHEYVILFVKSVPKYLGYRTGSECLARNKLVIREINFARNTGHKTENQILQNEKIKRNLLTEITEKR